MSPKMLKNLKTSSKISLKFTLFTIVIVFIFGVLANLIFFRMWYGTLEREEGPRGPENGFMREPDRNQERPERPEFEPQNPDEDFKEFRNRFIDRLSLTTDSEEYKDLQENTIFMQISKLGDEYFFYDTVDNRIIVKQVTPNIQAQKNLLITSIYLLIFSAILAYIVSLYFVKSSLRKLNDLVDYVKGLDLNNLEKKYEIVGPENDEINVLAMKINSATDKINKQTLALKDFISNASHELRTPLMSINSEIDYSLKSKEYKEGMENIKGEILNLNNLLDELVLISKLDADSEFKKSNKNISEVVSSVSKMIEKKYKDKGLKLELKCDDNVEKMVHNSSFEIIAKNLIENAFKYTNEGKITIKLNENEFSVKDTGIGIKKENLEKVWDRFWQEDSSKTDVTSFGLGLFLVKLLVNKHGWNIELKSTEGKGSEFKIIF